MHGAVGRISLCGLGPSQKKTRNGFVPQKSPWKMSMTSGQGRIVFIYLYLEDT